jgi:hypothetical protein
MAFPTGNDLGAFLTAGGLAHSGVDLDGLVASATDEFERRTGWIPFEKESADYADRYDPPACGSFGQAIELRQGLLSLTSLTVGMGMDGSGGNVLTEGTNFLLYPYDGGVDGRPWRRIEFVYGVGGLRRSIKVLGKRGFSTECPAGVFAAILHRAAGLAIIDLSAGKSGDLSQVTQGPVTFKYDLQYSSTVQRYQKEFDDCVGRYARL